MPLDHFFHFHVVSLVTSRFVFAVSGTGNLCYSSFTSTKTDGVTPHT